MANDLKEKMTSVLSEEEQTAPAVPRKFAIGVISIFMAILLLPTIAWGVLKLANLANPAIMETVNFDTGENRAMATFPTTFNPKTFTAEVESWYNDNLPFRSVLYSVQEDFKNALEKPWKETVLPALLKVFYPSTQQSTPPPQEEIKDPYGDDTPVLPPKQEENVPSFEIIDRGDQGCKHSSMTLTPESEASCSEYGSIIHNCNDCSFLYREYLKKLEHDYVCADLKEARCDVDVQNEYVCTVCNEVYVVTLQRKHDGAPIYEVEPSYLDYGYTMCECYTCGGQYRTNIIPKLIDNSYFPPIYPGSTGEAIEGRYQWLFYRPGDTTYGHGDSMDYFMATNLPTEEELKEYATTFKTLNDLLKARDTELVIAIFPNKEQVYPEYYPSVEIRSEYKRVERLVDYIKQNTDVKIVYPLQELIDAKPYWEVYYKHDTHWNHAGGFIGLQAIYKELGLPTTNLMSLPVFDSPETVIGDIIGMAQYSPTQYFGGKDYRVVYREEVQLLSEVGKYEVRNSRRTTSNGPIDKRLVWIGDSYRGFTYPYFEKDFTYTFHTHRSKVVHANAKPEVLEADILVLQIVERREPELLVMANSLIDFLRSSEAQ